MFGLTHYYSTAPQFSIFVYSRVFPVGIFWCGVGLLLIWRVDDGYISLVPSSSSLVEKFGVPLLGGSKYQSIRHYWEYKKRLLLMMVNGGRRREIEGVD